MEVVVDAPPSVGRCGRDDGGAPAVRPTPRCHLSWSGADWEDQPSSSAISVDSGSVAVSPEVPQFQKP